MWSAGILSTFTSGTLQRFNKAFNISEPIELFLNLESTASNGTSPVWDSITAYPAILFLSLPWIKENLEWSSSIDAIEFCHEILKSK